MVGYSLPNSDEFFRYFLPLGIIGPNIIRRVIVCDPDAAAVRQYEGILSQSTRGRLEPYQTPFSQAIQGIINKLGV